MHPNPLDDVVSRQYERWVYPEPIEDLPAWLRDNWQWLDPSHAQRVFWPDREPRPDLDILVAGCGTNQAAVLAFTNPQARVVAIDVSESSLAHHRRLAERYAMGNLELHRLPIEEVGSLGRGFDLVVSTGVLHHMADPAAGLTALAGCLRPDGVMALMLYARYGRVGVEMMQGAFREMGLGQDDASVRTVREVIATLPADHPVQSYLGIAPDLASDAGVVDTFLHGRDRSYAVDDCIELVESSGLVFQDWFLRAPYYPTTASGEALLTVMAGLPLRAQWAVMERLNPRNACHFFLACHPGRPEASYRVDFDSADFPRYVPSLRYRCALQGQAISRPDWSVGLDATQAAILARMDGRRDVAEILADVPGVEPGADLEDFARELFRSLWQLDFVQVELPPRSPDHP